MNATEDTIIEFLKSKAEAAGEEDQPYLLSFAAPEMSEAGIEYRTVLNGERLKAFVERTEGEGRYRVIKHPHQRAKIGLVKPDSPFESSPTTETRWLRLKQRNCPLRMARSCSTS